MSGFNNNNIDYGKLQSTKGKLRSIMEAARALTALGDEDEVRNITTGSITSTQNLPRATRCTSSKKQLTYEVDDDDDRIEYIDSKCSAKRFLPEHKKQDAAPTFPEKVSCYISPFAVFSVLNCTTRHLVIIFLS